MIIAETIRVKCVAEHCIRRHLVVHVPLAEPAAGLIARPTLICAECRCEVRELQEDEA